MGVRVARSCSPTASRYASFPFRATAPTAPAIFRSATKRFSSSVASPSLAGDSPHCIGRGRAEATIRDGAFIAGSAASAAITITDMTPAARILRFATDSVGACSKVCPVGLAEAIALVCHRERSIRLCRHFDPVRRSVVDWRGRCAGPGGGAGIAATGMAAGGSSITFEMKTPGDGVSCPLRSEKCTCQRSSRPGVEWMILIASGCPPFRVPLFMIATRG